MTHLSLEKPECGSLPPWRLRAGFRRLDLDGNGFITRDEVRALAERLYEESH